MADQTVMWTALPNGATGDVTNRRLRLSVLVSPRLTSAEPQPTLASFADFLAWPHRLAAGPVAFSVQTRAAPDSPPGPLVLATVVSPPPDPDLWQAVFGPSTPVESHRADQVSRVYSTYSMSAVHDQLKQGHQALAMNSPVELPGLATLRAGVPGSDAFAPMGEEQVIATLAPAPDSDATALHEVLNSLAANMFRSDNTTDISQRVAAAILHARAIAQRSTEPVEVMPRALRDGTGIVEPASELARVVAFTRGSVVALPAPPPPAALAAAPPPPAAPAAAGPPVFDFHHYLTFLADHPSLLRLLGLVIDLEVPAGSLPISPSTAPSPQLVQVLPTFATPLEGTVSPYTAYYLEGEGESFFSAAPAPGGPEILHGLLNLTLADQYDLIQVDVQGGALKLINTLAGQPAQQSPDGAGDQDGGLPAMRTSGVSIARADLAQRYVERAGKAAQNNTALEAAINNGGGDLPVLFAEDLTRGYRFDVFDAGARQWRSLHQRVGSYTFRQHPGGPVSRPADGEGAVQQVSTQPAGGDGMAPDPDVEHYIHESLMHWQGWSLSAPRPGKTITDDGPATVTSTAPAGGPQVDAAFQARPGSLPRLRFGGRYRFRARTVDLAGNGPDLDEATALLDKIFPSQGLKPPVLPQTDDFIYRRFEPVLSPVLVPRARLTEGETLERLVIRSRTGVGAAQEASDLTAAPAAGAGPAAHYQPTCERHLVPPKISQHMAETHGLFDASFGGQGGFAATYAVARKEKGRLTDTAVIDVGTGQPVPIADPDAVEVIATNLPSGDGYVIHGEPQLALPYLPDPMARAAALFGLPGVPSHTPAGTLDGQGQLVFGASSLPPDVLTQLAGSTVHIPFTGTSGGDPWPGRLSFRLIVAERTPDAGPQPRWDPQARTLTVFLAQAEQATVRLSSSISLDDLNQLGQWQWLLEASPGGVATDVAEQGGRWQLTPGRTLTLVHAVEQPLLAPDVKALTATRDPGATFCFLGGRVAAHGESTAKIDLLASWEDAADPPGAPPVPVQAHVFDLPIDLPAEGGESPPQDPGVVPVAIYDPSARELAIQAPPPGDESGRTYLARQEFGDTRHRTVRYSAVASSRFRDCFPAEIADNTSRTTLTGAATDVSVPSSSRPAAPDLVSVLPAFTWSREEHPDGSRVSIRNGSIRLYLRRPWYSSGSGELLAVLLTDPANYPPDGILGPLVTHWGRDPIWGQPERLDPPAPASFPRAVSTARGLHPDERPEANLVAAAHQVAHDAQRDLLYCDIAVNLTPNPYYPFVRLALARYQPDSLPGLELSRVVLSDYVQVAPQRTVTVSPDPGPDTFLVHVQGFSPLKFPFLFIRLIRVSVEQRIPGVEDADLGWTPVPDDTPGVTITATVTNQVPTLWQGHVTLPAGRDKGQFRIVVREVEPLPTDASGGSPDPDGRPVFAETMVM